MTSFQIHRAAIAFAMLCFLAAPALAAQRGQRRVLSNEDVAQPEPPPAPAEQPPASSGVDQPATPPEATAEEKPPTPQGSAKQLAAMLDAIGQVAEFLGDKIREGTADEATLARWNAMRDSLANVFAEFREFVTQAQTAAARAPAASSQPPSAPAAPPETAPPTP